MNEKSLRRGLYTIPSGTGFLKALAAGLMTTANGDERALAEMRVLLPTRRAGRELASEFLVLSGGKPLLLPRFQPIGDVDAEEIDLVFSGYGLQTEDIPPAISSLERRFLLAELVRKKDAALSPDAALSLAADLARLIDTVHTEDLDFSGLERIVPDDLSDHWKTTLSFLEIVTAFWPSILAERGVIDPADRRNRLLKSLARVWEEVPPPYPIIAAGSTGSIPAAGMVLKSVVLHCPRGMVILPGFDKDLDKTSRECVEDGHPQATMKALLTRMGKVAEDVRHWPESEGRNSPRADLLRTVMRPAETFAVHAGLALDEALTGLEIIEAASPREEAAVIALALRETLETPEKTACFVTPDRTLARRVMTALRRWGIEADDSAGGVLGVTAGATFLLSVLRCLDEDFAPLPLLELLKHDYFRAINAEDIALFERTMLRGGRPAPGLSGLSRRSDFMRKNGKDPLRQAAVLSSLEEAFAPMLAVFGAGSEASVKDYCAALLETAQSLCADKDFLWTRPESDALSMFLSDVMAFGDVLPPMSLSVFCGVFRELILGESYRATDEPHRRILILGQMESRLIQRDVMILGGLNEGTWPRGVPHDPWMSRPMRKKFGLPGAERIAGLSAHDFVEHAFNSAVIVTRSLKADGTATVPARWLQKLKTVLNACGRTTDWSRDSRYLAWARMTDAARDGRYLPAPQPHPAPPLSVRPQELSATRIEKWMNNPYRIYAEKILKLKRLPPVDEDTMHAERGNFVHDVLMDFVKAYPGAELPPDSKEIILTAAREKLAERENLAAHWHYWWPRFERIVDWFVERETEWRKIAMPRFQEQTGKLVIYRSEKTGRSFTVTAKADRIDRLKEGGAAVLDYKTGTPPSVTRVATGLAPQLPIEAFILEEGGYDNTPIEPKMLHYWRLSGAHTAAGEVKDMKSLSVPDAVTAAREGLVALVTLFEDEQTPYLAHIPAGRLYDDEKLYAHLARTAEWSTGEEGAEDDSEDTGGDGEGDGGA